MSQYSSEIDILGQALYPKKKKIYIYIYIHTLAQANCGFLQSHWKKVDTYFSIELQIYVNNHSHRFHTCIISLLLMDSTLKYFYV
jgi:hypothetical protein